MNRDAVAESGSRATDTASDSAAAGLAGFGEGWYRALAEDAPSALAVFGGDGRILFANRAAAELFGYDDAGALMRCGELEFLVSPEERAQLIETAAELLSGTVAETVLAWRGCRRDQSPVWVEMRARRVATAQGDAVLAVFDDLTGRRAIERELRARDEFSQLLADLLATFVNLPPDQIVDQIAQGLEKVGRALDVDRCSFYECAENGRSLLLVQSFARDGDTSMVPRDLTRAMSWFAEHLLSGRTMVTQGPLDLPPAAEAERRYAEHHAIRSSVAIPIMVGSARPCALVATSVEVRQDWRDATVGQLRTTGEIFAGALARMRGGEALRRSEERFRAFAAASGDWYWETDEEFRVRYVSDKLTELSGRSRNDLVDRKLWELTDDNLGVPHWRQLANTLQARAPFHDLHLPVHVAAGERHWSLSGAPVFGESGRFLGYRGTGNDITGEIDARVQLSDAIDSMTDGVVICDRENRIVLCNRAFRELNAPIAGMIRPGMLYQDLLRLVIEHDVVVGAAELGEDWVRERQRDLTSGVGVSEFQLYDGRWIQVVDRRTRNGFTVGLRTDITVPKQREEELRQAQKMEAIGQLTGGIAHDFNNLLAIIQGNLSYLERQLEADSPLLKLTAPALRATRRGAALTHRLLAFSRRQPLQDRVIDAGELLLGMQDLLHRSLGEQVSLEIVPEPGLWPCLIDPVQLEHAILNLAINARDAMPSGGRLLIETANAELNDHYAAAQAEVLPGSYVVIAVSDTGQGMSSEVMKRIFEPFFTTKEIGKGSGLGLSMVFGFVKQSNGHITVYSEPSLGSTFKLYLPRSWPTLGVSETLQRDATELPDGEGRTVLLVADDEDIRQMAALLLRSLDYRVHEATDGPTALRLLKRESSVDLLLTDLVLSRGIDGQKLASRARRDRPALRVLFMSREAPEDVANSDARAEKFRVLRIPFEPRELALACAEATR